MSSGNVVEIIGAVVDVEFPRDAVPSVYSALTVAEHDGLTMEVQAQLGDGVVRAIAMGATDGLKRGMGVEDTGSRYKFLLVRAHWVELWMYWVVLLICKVISKAEKQCQSIVIHLHMKSKQLHLKS